MVGECFYSGNDGIWEQELSIPELAFLALVTHVSCVFVLRVGIYCRSSGYIS